MKPIKLTDAQLDAALGPVKCKAIGCDDSAVDCGWCAEHKMYWTDPVSPFNRRDTLTLSGIAEVYRLASKYL